MDCEILKSIAVFILIIFILSNLLCAAAVETPAFNEPLSAKGAILIDAQSGKILFEKNADEKLRPASVTKIMTLLLIMEALDNKQISLSDTIKVSTEASKMGGSQIYLKAGETMSVEELLKSVVVASANDAAYALGEHVAGSNDGFVSMMNSRAKELGMNNTNFINSNGLDTDNHYTSARDIAIMSKELLKHRDITKYTTIWQDSVRGGQFVLSNTNKLLKTYEGITGLKTGSTSQSLYCISASAQRKNVSLVAVILGAQTSNDRFAEAKKLLDYGFFNYENYSIAVKDEPLEPISVIKGQKEKVNVQIKEDVSVLIKKGEQSKVKKEIQTESKLNAPINKGDKVGGKILHR
jgi:D-alanyl-D-alanine carboxypeptidase (penicillin-binding protein 5/6)